MPEALRPIYESFGISLEDHNGKEQFDLPLAATFTVDVKGVIKSAFVTTDYTERQEPAEAVSFLSQ